MKKIILSMFVMASIYSCKNKDQKSQQAVATDSLSVHQSADPEKIAFVNKETSPEELTQHLAKNNDTLYITNFFATWCGPCMQEIPNFKEKMQELKGKPVKFTFVDLDEKADWDSAVKNFVEENNLGGNVILVDGTKLDQKFFTTNFKQWTGGSIPFTYMRKGEKVEEYSGLMTEEALNSKISSLLQ
ncbi:TlpA family protein disulfide reductase [Chryseobacterium sp. JK1]|uniref:TlpA family protein disulfide reductase n=1 Tax=Chryseobacterium sp. JK1 TaxID=874294 RepID=UPI003D68DC0B